MSHPKILPQRQKFVAVKKGKIARHRDYRKCQIILYRTVQLQLVHILELTRDLHEIQGRRYVTSFTIIRFRMKSATTQL